MKKARIQFVGDYAEPDAIKLSDFLRRTAMYNVIELADDYVGQVDIEFNDPFDMKSQLHWLAVMLNELPSWHFVGPRCPGIAKVKHESGRQNMLHINHPAKGEQWLCNQMKCRMHMGVSSDDFMSMGQFRMTMQILQNDPSPIRKLSTTPAWERRVMAKPVPMEPEKDIVPYDSYVRKPDDFLLRRIPRLSEDDAKRMLDKLFEVFPAIKGWHQMSELTRLLNEKDNVIDRLKESNTEIEALRARLKTLSEETVAESTTELPVVKAADAFLRLMAGVNMQDHSVLEQREFNSKFKALMDELMKLGIGSTPGKKPCSS